MSVPQRYSLVTLGVADVTASTAFYRRLGWRPSSASMDGDITFISTPGGVLALWRADLLAADAGVDPRTDPAFVDRAGHQPRLPGRGRRSHRGVGGGRWHGHAPGRGHRLGWLQRLRGGPGWARLGAGSQPVLAPRRPRVADAAGTRGRVGTVGSPWAPLRDDRERQQEGTSTDQQAEECVDHRIVAVVGFATPPAPSPSLPSTARFDPRNAPRPRCRALL